MEQRWLVVYSESAYQRADKTLAKAQAGECEKVSKQLFHLQARRFDTAESAGDALDRIVKKLSYHKLETMELTQHVRYASRGRPKADSAIKGIKCRLQLQWLQILPKYHTSSTRKPVMCLRQAYQIASCRTWK